jgi:hypothetical protein
MKIAIATTFHPSLAHLAAITDQNKRDYAAIHGYDYHRIDILPAGMNYAWSRWRQFLDLFQNGYAWILCCGVDVIFTNFYIQIEALIGNDTDVIASRDALMIQGDVLLVRNSQKGREFLEEVISLEPVYRHDWFQDQTAMEHIIKTRPGLVTLVPQFVLQTYEYAKYAGLGGNYALSLDAQGNRGQWRSGDYILHVPGCEMNTKIAEIEAHLPMVIRPSSTPRLSNPPIQSKAAP